MGLSNLIENATKIIKNDQSALETIGDFTDKLEVAFKPVFQAIKRGSLHIIQSGDIGKQRIKLGPKNLYYENGSFCEDIKGASVTVTHRQLPAHYQRHADTLDTMDSNPDYVTPGIFEGMVHAAYDVCDKVERAYPGTFPEFSEDKEDL